MEHWSMLGKQKSEMNRRDLIIIIIIRSHHIALMFHNLLESSTHLCSRRVIWYLVFIQSEKLKQLRLCKAEASGIAAVVEGRWFITNEVNYPLIADDSTIWKFVFAQKVLPALAMNCVHVRREESDGGNK